MSIQATSQINVWFVYSRNMYTFTKIIFFHSFHSSLFTREGLWNHGLPGTISPSVTSYHRAPYLCKMPVGLQRKKKNTPTTLTSSSLCLGRLLALSLAFAVTPSLSPRKFQCTPLPEAPIYLNRWGPGSLCFPKCCCSWTSSYRYKLRMCYGRRETQQPFLRAYVLAKSKTLLRYSITLLTQKTISWHCCINSTTIFSLRLSHHSIICH